MSKCAHCGQETKMKAGFGRSGDESAQGTSIKGKIRSMNVKNEKTDFNRHHDNALAAIMQAKRGKKQLEVM